MEIAICQLLLGRKTEALATLGITERASAGADSAPDSGILDFITVNPSSVAHTSLWFIPSQASSHKGLAGAQKSLG